MANRSAPGGTVISGADISTTHVKGNAGDNPARDTLPTNGAWQPWRSLELVSSGCKSFCTVAVLRILNSIDITATARIANVLPTASILLDPSHY